MPKILRVKSGDDYDKRFDKINKFLLKPPFIGIINGCVRTGKSTILMNIIYNKGFYHELFDKIIFISPTVLNDVTLAHLKDDDEIIKIHDDLDALDDILKTIVEAKEKDNEENDKFYLIIMDDCLGFIKPRSYVSYLCTRYRQRKISLIFCAQDFRSIPNIIRTNATFYLLFKTSNKKEYLKYVSEFEGVYPDFENIYKIATEEPYNFLYLDLRNIKAYHNFELKL